MKVNVLCIGDIVGRPGRKILSEKLEQIVADNSIDCVIANAENAAGGSGLTRNIYEKLKTYGVNLITLGDHSYRKREIVPILECEKDIVRPLNWGAYSAGQGYAVYKTSKGIDVAVITVMGRTFMKPCNCPFEALDNNLIRIKNSADIVIVEVHAEATSEKIALGHYLDGKVSCVYGTHTHVATADECIKPKGTAYITDIGMTGPMDSVLGRNKESVMKSLRTQMPFTYEVATDDVRINGIIVTLETTNRTADSIKRVCVKSGEQDATNYDSDDGRPEPLSSF